MRTAWFTVPVLVLLLLTAALAKEYDHPLIEQTYRLLPNGDAEVEEVRTFRFSGSFSWANLKRSTRGDYGRYGIEWLGVWDADTGEPLSYSTSVEGDEAVLRWEYRAQNTTRRFRLRYRIRNAVQRYADVAQFYWKAIEDQHARLERVRIAIIPPAPSPKLFKVFVHSRAAPGRLDIAKGFARASVEQAHIPTDSFAEVRVMLDPAIFPNAPRQTGDRYKAFLQEEQRFAERELREAERLQRKAQLIEKAIKIETPIALALCLGLVGYLVWTYQRYGREPVLPDIEYEREPPRDLPPAVVPAILTQRKPQAAEVVKGFAATVLEAARLGYLRIEETQKAVLLGLFRSTERQYVLTPEGRALLMGETVQPAGRKERLLEPFERKALRLIIFDAGDGESVTEKQLKKWAEKVEGSKTRLLRFVERWGKEMRQWFEKNHFKLDDPHSEKARHRFLITVALFGVFASVLLFPASLFIVLPTSLIVAVIGAASLSRRSPEAAREVQRWQAFKRFMTDFSALREAGPSLLPLWERYLVYAVALGVADKFLRNLASLAQEYHYALNQPVWYAASTGEPLSADSLSGMTSLAENLQNLTSALSSSTSSGGGFSSGGGGGGGGGSSGAG